MKKEPESQKLSSDIKDWWTQIKESDMVVFEQFSNTSDRSEEVIEIDEEDPSPFIESQNLAVYQTPFGIVKIPEFCDINKHFKLWTMYTRNPIKDKLKHNIDNIKGVETFEVFTPYRARIGICPLYKDGEVLQGIKQAIENSSLPEKEKIYNNGV